MKRAELVLRRGELADLHRRELTVPDERRLAAYSGFDPRRPSGRQCALL